MMNQTRSIRLPRLTPDTGRARAESIVVSCEHAVNVIPLRYRALFRRHARLLRTHRAYDIGAQEIARVVSRTLRAKRVLGKTSRLVADLNRRDQSRNCLSRFTRTLSPQEKQRLLDRHHRPYRALVERLVRAAIRGRTAPAVHLSIHSFAPVLRGQVRTVDIGVLYDPRRPLERRVAFLLKQAFHMAFPDWEIASNRPYKGIADGLTTHLRTRFPATRYVGLEIEVNQKHLSPHNRHRLAQKIASAIRSALYTH